MDRAARLLAPFNRDMRLIEIGASYNPLIPKSDGWHTTVVDHLPREELSKLYPNFAAKIELVDYIWDGEALDELIPSRNFDGLIASHVGEHLPDFVGFLQAADKLLAETGVIALALPDLRFCFDFFRPPNTTGQFLVAIGRKTHDPAALFDSKARRVLRKSGLETWGKTDHLDDLQFIEPKLYESYLELLRGKQAEADGRYIDTHGWCFTPKSFELLILELHLLGLSPWAIQRIEPQEAIEFLVWLEKKPHANIDIEETNTRRMTLMREIVMETQEQQRALLHPSDTFRSSSETIAAIIPLYNGGKYIEIAVNSVVEQTRRADEIIVVDDGSTDDGPERVRAMIGRGMPIKLLRKENGGQSSARNYGAQATKATYLAFLDQDDSWYPRHLEKLLEPYQEAQTGAPLGWTYSNLDEVDDRAELVVKRFLSTLHAAHPKTDIFSLLSGDMYILPSASLVLHAAFDAVGGFDERLCGYEDDDLFLRLFRAGYANVYLDISLSKWRIHPGSASYTSRMRQSRAIYARKLLANFPDDLSRNRYYTRDLIVPRFGRQAIAEYLLSLQGQDQAHRTEARAELAFWMPMMSRADRMVARGCLRLRNKRYYRIARRMKPFVLPMLRRL